MKNLSAKLFIVLILLTLSFSCSRKADGTSSATWKTPEDTPEKAVEAVIVSMDSLIPEVRASGIIKGKNEIWLVSEAGGIVEKVNGEPGAKVEKGDLLIRIENEIPKAQIELTRQLFKDAAKDFEGFKSSFKQGGISRSDFNKAYTDLLKKESDFKTAKADYEKRSVTAPFDGYIALFNTEKTEGSYIFPGTNIARITDRSEFIVEISVGERQAYSLEKGLDAEISTDINGSLQVFDAVVTAVGAGSNPETGSFQVIAEWKNSSNDKILTGSSAEVVIKTRDKNRHIIIPSSAVTVRNSITSVFIEENGKAVLRQVETGKRFGNRLIIKRGLEDGETLITSGLNSLGNRDKVKTIVTGNSGELK
ncbi:MAG: efflux RND transporter periplasmic adaptor subunit [Spirochaetia bacterium]|jgi:membrane fusion protein (multidrug efflux system)|nr:efflux RND transporter periplasmic adaptor subunit [Spirochaetia bacterium]